MHLLVVTRSFPSAENPLRGVFIGEQVRRLSERLERITVLSPTTWVPAFMRKVDRVAAQASLPDHYQMVEDRCEVLFPRYLKAPGDWLLSWTLAQWRRIVEQTVVRFKSTCPVSIIHANAGGVSSMAGISSAKRHGIPSVVTYQGSEIHATLANHQKGWQLCCDSFRLADLNLCVSRSLENILRQSTQPTGRCEVLLRGVDRTRFFPAAQLTVNPHVLFVSVHIQRTKGAFDLLSAWAEVSRSCPGASLTMVGQDRTNGGFLEEAKSLSVDNSITLTGPLPSPAVAALMRQSRLLCLPSHAEGTPNCVMEALSCGLPVVATRVGGIPDIVEQGKSGLLVRKGDVEDLARALTTLLRDSDLCTRMGQAAQAFGRQHLDGRKTARRLVELYTELIRTRLESGSR